MGVEVSLSSINNIAVVWLVYVVIAELFFHALLHPYVYVDRQALNADKIRMLLLYVWYMAKYSVAAYGFIVLVRLVI